MSKVESAKKERRDSFCKEEEEVNERSLERKFPILFSICSYYVKNEFIFKLIIHRENDQ